MLFNLFGKNENEADNHVFVDKAYITSAAKMNACVALAKKEPDCLFICWFANTAVTYKEYFSQQGLKENLITETNQLNASMLLNRKPVFVEHYPVHSKELELIKDWGTEKIIVFSAMDEPLFKHFGSEKLIPLMKMLGMKEEEVIEHHMVSKSIIKGQEKIAQQVTFEQPASSQEEWMRKNLK